MPILLPPFGYFFNGNKNGHPAACGRFASYDEIILNFSCSPRDFKNPSGFDRGFISFINSFAGSAYSFFAGAALSLISAIIITLYLTPLTRTDRSFIPVHGPFAVFAGYAGLWAVIFFIFIFAGNVFRKFKNAKSFGGRGNFNFSGGRGLQEKPFELGILKGSFSDGASGKKISGLLIGLDEKKRFEHTLIVSPTGGGKTSRYVIPGIIKDSRYSDASVFAVDIDSPYLYGAVKNDWAKAGKTVVLFDPYEPEGQGAQIHFNPLTDKYKKPLSDDGLFNFSSMLFHLDKQEIKGGDMHAHKYYSKRSSDLFYGCLLYLKYRYGAKYLDLATAKNFFERGVKFIEKEITEFNGENCKKIKILFNNFFELPLYERAKIVTDVLNNLDFLNDSDAASRFRCKDGLNCFFIGDFFDKDTLFIAGIPKEKINSGGGRLISLITQIFIDAAYEDRRKKLRSEEGVLKDLPETGAGAGIRSFFMYLDEFPALNLNDFDTELANLRKTNTGVCITVQDIAFLKERYGDAALITSNIGTHIIMGHPGYETCRYYSERAGERYVFHKESVRKNMNPVLPELPSGAFGETSVASGLYPLISPDELKNMDKNSVFIYTKYVNPFILSLE